MHKPKSFRYADQWRGSPNTTHMTLVALRREQQKLLRLCGQGMAKRPTAEHDVGLVLPGHRSTCSAELGTHGPVAW